MNLAKRELYYETVRINDSHMFFFNIHSSPVSPPYFVLTGPKQYLLILQVLDEVLRFWVSEIVRYLDFKRLKFYVTMCYCL